MSNKKDNTLEKCNALIGRLNELKKAIGQVSAPSGRTPVKGMTGWSQDSSSGALHHGIHGVISTFKHPDGHFEIKHGGRSVGRAANIQDAGARIHKYVSMLDPKAPSPSTAKNPMAMKSDDEDDVEKSGYGPKGGGQYTPADNARRKIGNTGDTVTGIGSNKNVKSYTGRATAQKQKIGPASPVKQYSPQQIAAINEANKLKKTAEENPWVTHGNVPNGDEEVLKLKKTHPVERAENLMSNQLANMMQNKSMLGVAPPKQPTDEEMFGRFVPSEEEVQKAESKWNNTMNWLQEASKPLSARFDSPEAEQEYWDSLKVSDRDDGKSGY
jgi:hypothetical protein